MDAVKAPFTPRMEPTLGRAYRAAFRDDIIEGESKEVIALVSDCLRWINQRQSMIRRADTIRAKVPEINFHHIPAFTRRIMQLLEAARDEKSLSKDTRALVIQENNRICEAWDMIRKPMYKED